MYREVLENIFSVGFVDWHVRDFHGYETSQGSTYNAYLVKDEKTALIDTVKEPYAADLLANITELVPLDQIDYIVCNHAEPDHAGALAEVLAAIPGATLLCDKKCKTILSKHFDISGWNIQVVEGGETVSLGKRSLRFYETPMVHWPESMATYVPEEKLLFSMDAFGQHYATSGRFDDEVPISTAMAEAKTYYANIVMLYGEEVAKLLAPGVLPEIEIIAPSHGVIWRKYVNDILDAYRDWCVFRPVPKVLVLFDTMWQSTERMARAISEGATVPGVEVKVIHVRRSNLTIIADEVLDAACVAVGTSTLNQQMMPMMGATLTYLKGLSPRNKAGFAFGSFGWSKGGAGDVEEILREMEWEITRKAIRSPYRPTDEILEECRQAGEELAIKALETACAD